MKIPEGTFVYSDPLQFTVQSLTDLVVTIKAAEVPKDITGHPGSRETSYLAISGDVSAASLSSPVTTDHWYVLDGVEVRGKRWNRAQCSLSIRSRRAWSGWCPMGDYIHSDGTQHARVLTGPRQISADMTVLKKN